MSVIQKINFKKTDFSFKNNFNYDDKFSHKRMVFLWMIILSGYLLFIIQWYSIQNFAPGYEKIIGKLDEPALNAIPNWTITLMRGIGSILAGWIIVKVGHKYSVIIALSLMVISFPFIIVAKIPIGEMVNNIRPINFSLFVIFRLFLAIGGTSLITYTNSIIAKMSQNKKSLFVNINAFGFNAGAFFANIFFVFGISKFVNNNDIWMWILLSFVFLVVILLILYIIFGVEVIEKPTNITKFSDKKIGFRKLIKDSYTWKLGILFGCWLIVAIFMTSPTMRTFIEQSPANFNVLLKWNQNHTIVTSLKDATLNTASNIKIGSGYEWVWPTFISCFVSGLIIGFFIITPFNKTIYKRKKFMAFIFVVGLIFAAISIMSGYFGGYDNEIALTSFLFFIFLSGIFLWGIQPILLNHYQQQPQTTPEYAGVVSGMVWGLGYIFYTIIEIFLSISQSYVGVIKLFTIENFENIINKNFGILKTVEFAGSMIVIVGYFSVSALLFIPLFSLPDSGHKDKLGNFVVFNVEWKFWYWNFRKKEILF